MRVAIFGSREIDLKKARAILTEKMSKEHEYITSGNIKGVAKVGYEVAKEKGVKITLYNYRSNLGLYQALTDITTKNKKMVAEYDSALVLWNGDSKGTKREIGMLKKSGKPYELFTLDKTTSEDEFDFDDDFDFENL